jgi:hypothetical protein
MWTPRPGPEMENILMQIFLFHQYYDDGAMHNMCLQPDRETLGFFDRYRLIARQSQGVYALHYFGPGTPRTFAQRLINLMDGRPWVFNLISSKDNFTIITDLPVNWCGQLQYSSKSPASIPEPTQGQQQSSELSQTIELAMQLQRRTIAQASVAGQIVIFPQDLLTADGKMRRPSFSIKMKARLTQWRYYIFNYSQRKIAKLEINNAQGFVFDQPNLITFKNGEQALLFSSGEHSFALSETVKSPFNLFNLMPADHEQSLHPGSNLKQLITCLPIPKTDSLSIQVRDGHQYVYSPMYVYF